MSGSQKKALRSFENIRGIKSSNNWGKVRVTYLTFCYLCIKLAKQDAIFERLFVVDVVQWQNARLWIWLSWVRIPSTTLASREIWDFIIRMCDALVAQLDRATDFESVGRTFESCRAQKLKFKRG